MEKSAQYLKIVEWSDEDQCYVGRCPELMLGGVHGKNEQKVFAELCTVIDEWIEISKEDGDALPPGMAGKNYSGKFNLRLGKQLHERLAIAAVEESQCVLYRSARKRNQPLTSHSTCPPTCLRLAFATLMRRSHTFPNWRNASYNTIAAALDKLRLRTCSPCIGMVYSVSANSVRIASDKPRVSLPKTSRSSSV